MNNLIASLSEEQNVYQSLCSTLETKVGKREGEIIKIMARLARLDAQVRSLTQKNGEYKADLATLRGVIRSQEATIQQLHASPKSFSESTAGTSSVRENEEFEEHQVDCIRSLLERNMHLESLLSSMHETLAQRDATIDHLNDWRAKQETQILTLSQDHEKLKHFCTSLEETIAEDEEVMARLRITIAKEKAAAEWKTLFTLSRAQPHIHWASTVSTVGIFEAQNRKIAELQDKLSECHVLLVASRNADILMPLELLPFDGRHDGSSDSAPI
jgi:chromosome segregation ATPase